MAWRGNEDPQTDPWDLQSGIYEGDGFHPHHSFSGVRRLAFYAWDLNPLLGELRMIEPKFPFRQFFDFRFGVNASRFFNLPTLSKRCAICAIRDVRRATCRSH